MTTVKAYYNGSAFVPMEPFHMKKGNVVKLSIVQEDSSDEIAQKLAALQRITDNLREINETEPLPPEFDEIMSQRVNFSREIDL